MSAARSTPIPPRPAPDYARYERMKRELVERDGPILPLMYDVEMRRMGLECGV